MSIRMSRRVVVAFSLVLAACGGAELDANKRQWSEQRPESYSFVYSEGGFSPHRAQDYRIEVEGNEVVAVTFVGEGDTPDQPLSREHAPTIDALFETIEKGLDDGEFERATYAQPLGFPVEAHFANMSETWSFKTREFVAL